MSMRTGLYGILFPSGKWYWGQGNYKDRCRSYRTTNAKGQKELMNAIKCYGWDSTKRVFYPMPKEMAVLLEPLYIEFYDSFHNGYNGTEGGDGGLRGYKASAETRKKIADGNRGKVYSLKTRMKMSEWKRSDESKEKMGKANRGRKRSDETRMKISMAAKKRWNK